MHNTLHIYLLLFCVYVGGICSSSTSQSLIQRKINAVNESAEVKQSQLFQYKFKGRDPIVKHNFPSVNGSDAPAEFLTELKEHLKKSQKDCRSLPHIYYLTSEKSNGDIFRYV